MDVAERRRLKDAHFAQAADSPLPPELRARFTGLRYYPEDPSLHLEATLERAPETRYDEIQTSDGRPRVLARAGTLTFAIDGVAMTLVAYDQGDVLFVPFSDATSATETYEAGRYVEAEPIGDDRYVLDFNTAYNPYCAYSDAWSCPLPPHENRLGVPIRAGERRFA